MKINKFLSDSNVVNKWLSSEKKLLESNTEIDAYMDYWNHPEESGFGVVITAVYTGEFHIKENGDVSGYVENSSRKEIYSRIGKVMQENELKEHFENFKLRVFGKGI